MFSACNTQGELVHAGSAQKGQQYTCWVCGQRVLLKKGSIKNPHFAHEGNTLCNGWSYQPMTKWHYDMQQYFCSTEVPMVNKDTGERHIADALVKLGTEHIVFEFQHSSISAEEVQRRTAFYLSMGCKVVWVFNLTDKFRKAISPWGLQEDGIFCWKNPLKSFQHLPLYQLHDHVRILFYWKEYASSGNCREILNPVCWTPLRDEYNNLTDDYSPDFRVFAVSNQIVLSSYNKWPVRKMFEPINPDFLFYERAAKQYLEILNSSKQHLSSKVSFHFYRPHHKKMQIRILSANSKWLQKLLNVVEESEGDDEIIIIDADSKKHQNNRCSAEIINNKIRFDLDVYEASTTRAFSVYTPVDNNIKWL